MGLLKLTEGLGSGAGQSYVHVHRIRSNSRICKYPKVWIMCTVSICYLVLIISVAEGQLARCLKLSQEVFDIFEVILSIASLVTVASIHERNCNQSCMLCASVNPTFFN